MRASILIPNWNGAAYVRECVDAALAQTASDLEVVVLDNGSTDGSRDLLRGYGARIRLVENRENRGYAAGNNQLFAAAKGEHFLLLNADAVPEPGWAEALLRAADADPRIGLCASKVLAYDAPEALDGTGHLLWPDGANRARGRGEPDRGQYDGERDALFPSGAACLVRRKVVEETGGFDEDFFAYGDDTDLGLHALRLGWRCAYAPEARARHRFSAATGAHSAFKLRHVERNRLWLAVKYFPLSWLLAAPFWTLARAALHAAGAASGRGVLGGYARDLGGARTLGTVLAAWAEGLAGVPRMWAKRRRIRPRFRVGDREFAARCRAGRIPARALAVID